MMGTSVTTIVSQSCQRIPLIGDKAFGLPRATVFPTLPSLAYTI